MVKIILIKFPDEWATTKQACRDELAVYLSFSSHDIYIALLLCIEHCFTKVKILLFIYIYIYIYIYIVGGKRQINYNFIPTGLFRGCPLINPLMSGKPRNRSVGINL